MMSPISPVCGSTPAQAGRGGRRAAQHAQDHHPVDAEARRGRLLARDDADAGIARAAVADQLGHDAVHDVDRDREADAGAGPGRREDRGVHADEAPGGIEERTAGIARIDRRVGLDHAGELAPLAGGQAALQGADHAGRQGVVEAERIADGEGRLADLEVGRGADGQGLQRRRWCARGA